MTTRGNASAESRSAGAAGLKNPRLHGQWAAGANPGEWNGLGENSRAGGFVHGGGGVGGWAGGRAKICGNHPIWLPQGPRPAAAFPFAEFQG